MNEIEQDVKSRNFKRVYLICGDDEYLKRNYKKLLVSAIDPDGSMNFMTVRGKEVLPRQILDFLETMPFFADYRLVVMEDTLLFASSSDEWTDVVSAVPDSAVLIFSESKVDKRNKLYKAVKAAGCVCEFNTPDLDEMKRCARAEIKKRGCEIDADACDAFARRCGGSFDSLRTQLEKLISYVGDGRRITMEDVDAVCLRLPEDQVFSMIEAASEKNMNRALFLYGDLLSLKEPPLKILYLIARQCGNMLAAKDLAARGENAQEIAQRLKLNRSFFAEKLLKQSRHFKQEELSRLVGMCLEMEERVKTGRMDETVAVETVLVSMSSGNIR